MGSDFIARRSHLAGKRIPRGWERGDGFQGAGGWGGIFSTFQALHAAPSGSSSGVKCLVMRFPANPNQISASHTEQLLQLTGVSWQSPNPIQIRSGGGGWGAVLNLAFGQMKCCVIMEDGGHRGFTSYQVLVWNRATWHLKSLNCKQNWKRI